MKEYRTAQLAAGRADGTIRLHQHYLHRLAERHPDPWAVSLGDLQNMLAVPHWKPETRKSCRAAFRGFYRWAYGAGQVDVDPSDTLPAVTVPRAVARPAPEHLVRMVTANHGRRVGLMAMLAAYCGLRRGEIAQVHSRDLVVDELLVMGKGGKTRAVPVVYPPLVEAISGAGGWLFPNGHGSHLSPGHVGKLLSAAMPDGWTAHTLRHRMASVSYAGTRDLLAVGAVLGHSRPETTQRYIRLPDDALRAAVMAATAA